MVSTPTQRFLAAPRSKPGPLAELCPTRGRLGVASPNFTVSDKAVDLTRVTISVCQPALGSILRYSSLSPKPSSARPTTDSPREYDSDPDAVTYELQGLGADLNLFQPAVFRDSTASEHPFQRSSTRLVRLLFVRDRVDRVSQVCRPWFTLWDATPYPGGGGRPHPVDRGRLHTLGELASYAVAGCTSLGDATQAPSRGARLPTRPRAPCATRSRHGGRLRRHRDA